METWHNVVATILTQWFGMGLGGLIVCFVIKRDMDKHLKEKLDELQPRRDR